VITKASSSIEVMRSHIAGPKRLMPLRLGGLPAPISGVRLVVAALRRATGASRDASPVASGEVLGAARHPCWTRLGHGGFGVGLSRQQITAAAESLAGASRLPGYVPAVNAVFA
jgi:hypothetical protein